MSNQRACPCLHWSDLWGRTRGQMSPVLTSWLFHQTKLELVTSWRKRKKEKHSEWDFNCFVATLGFPPTLARGVTAAAATFPITQRKEKEGWVLTEHTVTHGSKLHHVWVHHRWEKPATVAVRLTAHQSTRTWSDGNIFLSKIVDFNFSSRGEFWHNIFKDTGAKEEAYRISHMLLKQRYFTNPITQGQRPDFLENRPIYGAIEKKTHTWCVLMKSFTVTLN